MNIYEICNMKTIPLLMSWWVKLGNLQAQSHVTKRFRKSRPEFVCKASKPHLKLLRLPGLPTSIHAMRTCVSHVSMIVLGRTVCDWKVSQCLFPFDCALGVNCAARYENQKVQFQLLTFNF